MILKLHSHKFDFYLISYVCLLFLSLLSLFVARYESGNHTFLMPLVVCKHAIY